MENYVISLDLGTSSTSIIAGLIDESAPYSIRILHQETVASQGIKRGEVYNIDAAQKIITNLIIGAEKKIKRTANTKRWYVANIGGMSYRCEQRRSDMNTQGQTIQEITINQLNENAKSAIFLSDNEEVTRFIPMYYSLDSGIPTRDPIGMAATKTEGTYLVFIADKESIGKVNSLLQKDRTATCTYTSASSKGAILLTEDEKKNGCVIVDLGAGTTNVAVYYKGVVNFETTIPFGSDTITSDIAHGLKIDRMRAESIKRHFGLCGTEVQDNERFVIVNTNDGNSDFECDKNKLDFIIRARVEEIVRYVDSAIFQQNRAFRSMKSIVLCGGGSELKNIDKVFSDNFGQIAVRKAKMPPATDDIAETLSAAFGMATIFIRENKKLYDNRMEQSLFSQPAQPDEKNQETTTSEPQDTDNTQDKNAKGSFWDKFKNGFNGLMQEPNE